MHQRSLMAFSKQCLRHDRSNLASQLTGLSVTNTGMPPATFTIGS